MVLEFLSLDWPLRIIKYFFYFFKLFLIFTIKFIKFNFFNCFKIFLKIKNNMFLMLNEINYYTKEKIIEKYIT